MSRFLFLFAATIGLWTCGTTSALAESDPAPLPPPSRVAVWSAGESSNNLVAPAPQTNELQVMHRDYSVLASGAEVALPGSPPMPAQSGFVEQVSEPDDLDCNYSGSYARGQIGCCRSTCDMVPHYHYYPPMHGHYYFRPYSYHELLQQRVIGTLIGEDPKAPYTNRVFTEVYREYEQRQQAVAPPAVPGEPSSPAVPPAPSPDAGA